MDLTIQDKNYINYAVIKLGHILREQDIYDFILNNPNYKYLQHVILHRESFKHLEAHTPYHGKYSGLHDIDKVGLCLVFDKDMTKQLHKRIAEHHNIDWSKLDKNILIEKAFDWESCHYTKLDNQCTAWEYLQTQPTSIQDRMTPILKELGFTKTNTEPLTPEKYDMLVAHLHMETIIAEVKKSYAYLSTLI